MKLFLLSLCLMCLIGCGKGEDRQARHRVVYPALTESPPPLLPTISYSDEEPEPRVLPDTVIEDSWMGKQIRKEIIIKDLKEQAIRDPESPFALTEENIEELSKIDDLAIQ